jgi:uncharacterized membrane protein YdjX (TVP38/TMEM64 family)
MTRRVLWIAFLGGLVVLVVWLFDRQQHLLDLLAHFSQPGTLGLLLFAAAAVPACVFFVPVTLLALAAGFQFGIVPAALTVSVAGTLGAALTFLLGRTLLRSWVEKQVAARPRCRALLDGVGRRGFQVVLLTRLSPVLPSNFFNYAFGLTDVSLPSFTAASWLGMLPACFYYGAAGTAVQSLADVWTARSEGQYLHNLFLGVGALATIAATAYVTWLVRRSLRQAAEPSAPITSSDPS